MKGMYKMLFWNTLKLFDRYTLKCLYIIVEIVLTKIYVGNISIKFLNV